MRNVIIIGSGPAGLTAAIYASRARLEPLMFEGVPQGGQLMTTTDVENYPGFPDGIQGPEFIELTHKQAEKFGTEFLSQDVTRVDLRSRPFKVYADNQVHEAKAVILSTGARPRMLGLPEEHLLMGHGLSTCATCDGAFFQNKRLVVVGGGDSAMEESTFLTRYASQVQVVHRRDKLRASAIMQERAFKNPKISFAWNSTLESILDPEKKKVSAVRLRNVETGEAKEQAIDGVFYALGHLPNTDIFKGQLELDPAGYLITKPGSTATIIPGVFAAGDCVDHVYRQAVTAAGMGCMAALDAQRYLEATGH